jgi:thioredoxin-dependent peroxiredoxin
MKEYKMRFTVIAIALVMLMGCVEQKSNLGHAPVVTMKGTPVTLLGKQPKVGDKAPDFSAFDVASKKVSLSDFAGKPVLISIVPNLETKVCSLQTIRFNEELKKLPENVVLITISMNLPFAQKNFCEQEKIDRITMLSDSANKEFGKAYGLIIKETGLLSRSIFVVNKKGKITYIQIVPELSNEPDYEPALKAIREAAE